MRILAIDVGWTTGVVSYNTLEEDQLFVRSITRPRVLELTEFKHDLFLIERIPKKGDSITIALYWSLVWALERQKARFETPGPAEWKPWIKRNPLPIRWKAQLSDIHQQDAASILYWWLRTHPSEDATR